MNLFRRKRCCSELIAIKNGNLVFKLSNTHINAAYNTLQAIMRKSGIFDENLYLTCTENIEDIMLYTT